MLLQTLRTLVARVAKYLPLDGEPPPISNLTRPSTATNSLPSLPAASAGTTTSSAEHLHTYQPTAAEQVTAVSSVPSLFQGAHDMVINNPTISQIIYAGNLVFHLLAQKSLPGATLDSSVRSYVPRCHPDTRKSLRYRITKWAINPDRGWKMLWVSGFAGVGKSAIAQSVAEAMQKLNRLGAVFFFSRSSGLADSERVIPTIAYQLAIQLPEYKRIITQRIADDPLILEKNIRFQFKALIAEPLQFITTQYPRTLRDPLLVIIDGLDECSSVEAQCEFVELINTHAQSERCPLLWMICSRPEWHLKSVFSDADFHITCRREEVSIDDSEAQQDVVRVLDTEFEKIRRKYSNQVDSDWPSESHLRRIAASASGHLGLASFIVRFIGDQEYSDPAGRLGVCLKFLGRPGEPFTVNPLHALDLLFRQILSEVPSNIMATTMRILGLIIFFPHPRLCARNQANFFSLDRALFYRSLRQLHSVLEVPSSSDVHGFPVRVYHASFSDFLRNPRRSRKFAISEPTAQYDVAVQSLRWQNHADPSTHVVKWNCADWGSDILRDMWIVSEDLGWEACCRVSDEDVSSLVIELERFDFSGLERAPSGFKSFLPWLYSLGNRSRSLVTLAEAPETEISEAQLPTLTITDRDSRPSDFISSTYPGASASTIPGGGRQLKLVLGKTNPVLISLIVNSGRVQSAADHKRKRVHRFSCSICGTSFTTRQNLQNHMNSHSGVKAYICPIHGCGKRYAHSRSLNRHVITKHGHRAN